MRAEVLSQLGPRDLASLAGAGRACAAVVAATAVMMWAKDEKNLPPRPHSILGHPAPRLCLRQACSLAALGGHLEVLKLIHSIDCPCDTTTCCVAAEGGYLEVLKWLHTTGCQWDSSNALLRRR